MFLHLWFPFNYSLLLENLLINGFIYLIVCLEDMPRHKDAVFFIELYLILWKL